MSDDNWTHILLCTPLALGFFAQSGYSSVTTYPKKKNRAVGRRRTNGRINSFILGNGAARPFRALTADYGCGALLFLDLNLLLERGNVLRDDKTTRWDSACKPLADWLVSSAVLNNSALPNNNVYTLPGDCSNIRSHPARKTMPTGQHRSDIMLQTGERYDTYERYFARYLNSGGLSLLQVRELDYRRLDYRETQTDSTDLRHVVISGLPPHPDGDGGLVNCDSYV
ncbi:hypothetical protein B0H14DRAFT_2607030 [Mycena olivaceomarginata]|nr:hypothetical protein B0H14DRAFT_2607030 [Mycena olivaceomarginata]